MDMLYRVTARKQIQQSKKVHRDFMCIVDTGPDLNMAVKYGDLLCLRVCNQCFAHEFISAVQARR